MVQEQNTMCLHLIKIKIVFFSTTCSEECFHLLYSSILIYKNTDSSSVLNEETQHA